MKRQQNIKCDWLQIACKGNPVFNDSYQYKDENKRTKHFLKLIDCYNGIIKIATFEFQPSSKIIAPDICIIKFDNALLYQCNIYEFALRFINEHNLIFNNITRIDFCVDFNRMYNNLNPQCFIRRVVKNKLLSNMRSLCTLKGRQNHRFNWEYLRYGSHKTLVSSYLYNKSKEMKDCIFKPYIYKSWQDEDLNLNVPVWRLEFTVRPSRFNFMPYSDVNTSWDDYKEYLRKFAKTEKKNPKNYKIYCDTNNLTQCGQYSFDLNFLLDEKNVNAIFQTLLDNYFCFKTNTYIKNKTEMPDFQIFRHYCDAGTFIIHEGEEESNRSDKIFLKRLNLLEIESQDKDDDLREAIKFAKLYFSESRGFTENYNRKIENTV